MLQYLMDKNNIKDKDDVFFFDDDKKNTEASQNIFVFDEVAEKMKLEKLKNLPNNINATHIDNNRPDKQGKPGFIQENVDKLMEDLGLSF